MSKYIRSALLVIILFTWGSTAYSQKEVVISVHANKGTQTIPKEIYGQFAEHLGRCIYGGIWVGPESNIPNTQGYRNDVLEALKTLKVPVLRWPGGCFADEYHWMDGIGQRDKRPKMVNSNWGGTLEDNSFGTHEFLNLCEMLGCEPYVSGNVGSGSVEELARWVEYMTAEDGPMALLRKENGREKPWKVKYLGIGNESWGCGGNMRAEYYADLFRRYSTFCRNFDGNHLFKIASGASDYNYLWTETLLKEAAPLMDGISLHYYTIKGWNGSKGSATNFNDEEYYWTLGKCLEIEDVIKKHISIMDSLDSKGRIALLVDEWGTWWDVEPGTNPGHLYQQNSMRDALVASLTLDIFHKYTSRIKMANIAQMANVLQAMILTQDDKMVLTPTYHVFEMYNVHQGATFLPLEVQSECKETEDGRIIPKISATASKDDKGLIHVSISNVDLEKEQKVRLSFDGVTIRNASARILTSKDITDCNTFEAPTKVSPKTFSDFKMKNGYLEIRLPEKSIVVLEIK